MHWKLITILLVYYFCATEIHADILILNLNKNDSTIKQVRKYADQNDENLIIYPNKNIKSINSETIEGIVSYASRYDVNKIIISGHSTPGSFSGKSGELKQSDLLDEIKKHGNLSSSVDSLILRGCYTTRLNEILSRSEWRSGLPNLRYISGYDGRAWSSETSLSQNFMFDALQLEDSIVNAESSVEIVSNFKEIRNYDKSAIALWVNTGENEYYITSETISQNKPIIDFNKIKNICHLNNGTRQKYNALLEKYDHGSQPGYERPPADQIRGELRKIYEQLLKNQHCVTLQIWEENEYYDVNKAAALLFFNRLTQNYQKTYDQSELQLLIDQLNSSTKMSFVKPDLYSASREELRTFTYSLNTEIYNQEYNGFATLVDEYTLSRLEYHMTGMYNLIVNLDTSLIPHQWLTEDNSDARPMFLTY